MLLIIVDNFNVGEHVIFYYPKLLCCDMLHSSDNSTAILEAL